MGAALGKVTNGAKVCAGLVIMLLSGGLTSHATASSLADACPAPGTVLVDLEPDAFYLDRQGSIVDLGKSRSRAGLLVPLTDFTERLAEAGDLAILHGSTTAARCALEEMAHWARYSGLMGRLSPQGRTELVWNLVGLSASYLKLKKFANLEQSEAVETWLRAIHSRAAARFPKRATRRSNIYFWYGLGLRLLGMATRDDSIVEQSRDVFAESLAMIGADGFLEMESRRGRRSLLYHAYALLPLTIFAEIEAASGRGMDEMRAARLQALAHNTLLGLCGDRRFDVRIGVEQDRTHDRLYLIWASLIRNSDRALGTRGACLGEAWAHRWIGGDIRRLLDVIRRG